MKYVKGLNSFFGLNTGIKKVTISHREAASEAYITEYDRITLK
jgi:hypothetical protein